MLVALVVAIFNHHFNFVIFAACTEFMTHLLIGIQKGYLNVDYPPAANPANKVHWYAFGLDQTFHLAVLVFIAAIVMPHH